MDRITTFIADHVRPWHCTFVYWTTGFAFAILSQHALRDAGWGSLSGFLFTFLLWMLAMVAWLAMDLRDDVRASEEVRRIVKNSHPSNPLHMGSDRRVHYGTQEDCIVCASPMESL